MPAGRASTTYRCLRLAMPALVLLLAASIVAQAVGPSPHCWLGSISAYYYTSTRTVFVACLCAIGACMVVSHGNSPRERFALCVSGSLAFVVALVPPPLSSLKLSPARASCHRGNVPTGAQLAAAVDNNLLALLVMASAVLGVAVGLVAAARTPIRASVVWAVPVVALGGCWALYWLDRPLLRHDAHVAASVGMFLGMVGVVLLNAVSDPRLDPQTVPAPPPYPALYRAIVITMAVSGATLALVAWLGPYQHTVFWLESSLTTLYAVFWTTQSTELWSVTSRSREPPASDQPSVPDQPKRNGSAG
jgi:hypothetical protein